jgi:hypothetical protein
MPNARGVVIASTLGSYAEVCPPTGFPISHQIRNAPEAFLEDLHTVRGITFGTVTPTMLDGRPAITTTVDSIDKTVRRCVGYDVSTDRGGTIDLSVSSRLILAEIGHTTIIIQIWAPTSQDLAAWMPVATELIDSIHFIDQPGDSTPMPLETATSPAP